MEKQTPRSRRLVLVPCPYQGHINPMLQLGTVLHSRGFSMTIAHTIFNSPNPQNHPNCRFLPLQDGLSQYLMCSRCRHQSEASEHHLKAVDSLSNELVPELNPLRFKDLLFTLTSSHEKFSVIVGKIYGNTASSAIIWNTTNRLEQSALEQIQQQSTNLRYSHLCEQLGKHSILEREGSNQNRSASKPSCGLGTSQQQASLLVGNSTRLGAWFGLE
ncbi:hypothetical protein TIFTF001_000362 [Ficus carica]|uniref:UDP-glycosyltransferase n=1 Tax=Ficus carica TaxID=3494 RepID=A0AA87Z9V9_FICCA|nr:hypothetical protein TIFTF001_000362 [Ficus carica]